MPFDVAGARSAGYSDSEIASFLGSQSGFDVDGAVKAGYQPAEIIGFLGDIKDRGPVPQGDPATRVSTSTSSDSPTFTASPLPDAGAGRGKINPQEVNTETVSQTADRLDKNVTGSVISGVREMAGAAGIATMAPAKAIDFVHGLITGKDETGAQDYAGRTFVDPNLTAAEQWAPKAEDETHIAGKVLNGLARMAPTLAAAIATGGASAPEQSAMGLDAVRQAIAHGMRSMSVPAFSSGIAKSADLIQKGAPISEAVIAGLTEGATSDITGGLAMSAPGANAATRFAQGAAVGATTGEVARQAQNLAAPDFQTELTPEGLAVSAITGGLMGTSMAHPQERLDLREPAKRTEPAQEPIAPKAEDIAPAEVANAPEPVKADPIAKIAQAGSVDEAIAAAQEAVKAPVLSDDLLKIRPLKTADIAEQVDAAVKSTDAITTPLPDAARSADQDLRGAEAPALAREVGNAADEPASSGSVPQDRASDITQTPPLSGVRTSEPDNVWFGRSGDGYKTVGDATLALPTREKIAPDLTWKIEQMASGRYRLAGYKDATESAAPYYVVRPDTGERIPVASPERAADSFKSFSEQTGGKMRTMDVYDAKSGQPAYNVMPDGSLRPVETADQALSRSKAQAAAILAQQALDTQNAKALPAPKLPAEQAASDIKQAAAKLESQKAPTGSERMAAMEDAARQRREFAEAEKARTAPGARARARAQADNPLKAFLGKYGLSSDLASEYAPGLKERRSAMVQGYGPVFRKNGLQLDELAQRAVEQGFLKEPDANELYGLIQRGLSGERIIPQYAEGAAEAEMTRQQSSRYEQEVHALDGFVEDDLNKAEYAKAAPEVQDRVRELVAQMHAAGRDSESVLEEVAKKTENATEQDYYDAAEQALHAALSGEGGASASDRSAPSGRESAAPGESQGLSRPSREDILAQQEQAARGELAQRAKDKQAEDKSRADAMRGEFRLSGSDRAADANPDQGAMFSRDKAEPFYSALAREVGNINAKAQGADGWRAQIQGLVKNGKVNADEVEWTGLNDWLKLQSGKVSKEQINEFLKNNGVQVKEVVRGENGQEADRLQRESNAAEAKAQRLWDELEKSVPPRNGVARANIPWWAREASEGNEESMAKLRAAVPAEAIDKALEFGRASNAAVDAALTAKNAQKGERTKYEQYTLPGGENYREVLLTLPETFGAKENADGYKPLSAMGDAQYRSGHWDEPNVLAHIRLNDRTDSEGKRVLFVEEIQSDWGQAGKKQGFADKPSKPREPVGEIRHEPENEEWPWGIYIDGREDNRSKGNRQHAEEVLAESMEIARRRAARLEKPGIPSAPFVGKTDAWVSLAIKRILKMAVDEGYDRVAFVNGEQSAQRYDLSKQISRVSYSDGNVVRAYDLDGKNVINRHLESESELPDLVGKEVAQRLIDAPKTKIRIDGMDFPARELSGLDLKVGGEGMKAFYDKIVPTVAKDVLRKLGGEGLTSVKISAQQERSTNVDDGAGGVIKRREPPGETLTQPGFDITPAMREKVAGGVPLFKRGDSDGSTLHPTQIQRAVDKLTLNWLRKPDIHILDSMADAPDPVRAVWERQNAQGAAGNIEGFHYKGGVYVVADAMHSGSDIIRVLYHESLGHFGLRQVFGDRLDGVLKQVAAIKAPEIKRKAQQYGFDLANERQRMSAAEEVLAEMAQTRPENSLVQRAVAAIRTFLRENVPGFESMKLTDGEIIRNFLAPAREFVENGRRTEPTFSRSEEAQASRAKTADAAPDEEPKPYEAHKGLISSLLDHAINPIAKGIDAIGNKSGIYDLVAPMSDGTQKTRALAQAWINNSRKADYSWSQIDKTLTTKFTLDQRKKMWDAADQENDLRRNGIETEGTGKGLDSLTPTERSAVDTMHAYSQELWDRAKEVDWVTGEGVHYWTPRMMVEIGEGGEMSKPSEGKQGTSEGVGRNFSTAAGSAKHRKYETAAETEAAMNAKGGALVRDIRTMPLAMAKFEKAIAGRELINQIKDLGVATGKKLVSSSGGPGFFTLDHPAFKTYGPRFDENGIVNKEDGSPVIDAKPLYISDDFKGPLKAILSQGMTSNKIYTGYMLLKSKSMSAIMYSPLVHNQVILGRALAYGGVKTPLLYFTGHAAKSDIGFMQKMIGAGMVPIGTHNNMLDVGDVAGGGKPGSWSDPNESWIGLGAQKAGNALKAGIGDKLKAGIDYAGDVWHNKLLWERVGDLQAGIAKDVYTKLIAKGLDENAATTVAAHISNRYAGAVGKENMSELAHISANILLFSKSFNAGNVGSVKDAFYGLPAGLKAQLAENSDAASAVKALDFAKHKARIGLVRDAAFAILITSLVQDWVKRDKDKSFAENVSYGLQGYQKRAAEAWANAKGNPLKADSYNPYRLSSTWANEPGKDDRVDMGEQPSGRHEYMRLPTGKVIEDLAGWTTHFWDTADKKKSPLMSAVERMRNVKDPYGTPVWDTSGTVAQGIWDVAKALVGTQVPIDQAQNVKDIAAGHGTDLDKAKLLGNFTGLSVSQGHPQGPEGAVAAKTQERLDASKKYAMEQVKRDLKYGDVDQARERLEAIGFTPREINVMIRRIEDPKSGLSRSQRQKFNRHATEDERQLMEQQR